MRELFRQESAEQQEARIIEKILFQKRDIPKSMPGLKCWGFQYGGKVMELSVSEKEKEFRTYVLREKDKRLPHETTLLYKAAKSLMEQIAKESHQNFTYEFHTKIPEMAAWAKTSGNEVFEWDEHDAQPHEVHYYRKKFLGEKEETSL